MLKRQHYMVLGAVVLLTLLVLKLPSRTAAQLKLAISGIFLPLFGLTDSAHRIAQKAGNAVIPRKQLLQQLDQLRKENQELRAQALRLEESARESVRLRQALGWAKDLPWKYKVARVIGRDPANWWRALRIDLGMRDGVVPNCPVFVAEGLVGRVSEANYNQAQVVLLGDPDCRVSVTIMEDNRILDMGVIAPSSSSLDKSIVDIGLLSRNSGLRPGQRVMTSGQGGVFPPGIPVGYIIDWRSVGYGLYNEARARLAVNINAVEEVFVKLP
jgi:rod shape-determining protein MreC